MFAFIQLKIFNYNHSPMQAAQPSNPNTIAAHHQRPIGKLTYVSPDDPKWKQFIIRTMELFTGYKTVEKRYNEIQAMDIEPIRLWGETLKKLEISMDYNPQQLAKIPKEGSLVLIANHPFGVVDGLILGNLTSMVRKEFLFLVYDSLCQQDERINQFLLPVDFRATKEALRTNIQTRKEAIKRLDEGGTLLIFPAGGVSTAPKGFGKAEDLEWKRFVVKVIQRSKATIVPVFFHGQNSRMFHIVSQFSAPMRLGMLIHEVKNKMGKTLKVEIGNPIHFEQLAHIKDRQAFLDHLKAQVYQLE